MNEIITAEEMAIAYEEDLKENKLNLWKLLTLKQQGWLFTIPEHIRRISYDQLIIASRPASFL